MILNGLPPLDEGKWRKIEPPAPLPATPSPSRDAVAAHWRAAEHYAKTQAGRDLKRSRYPQATKDLKAAAGVARARLRPDPLPDVPHLSLANFPQAFLPLTIILGDRREWPLKSPGDLLAWSPSMLDVMHLHRLGLGHALEQGKDVQIMSDKYFVDLDDDGLSVRLNDRHLLSIGSPAANLGTRFLNAGAFFPFAPAGAERWVRARGNLRALLRTPERLRGFADYIDHLNDSYGAVLLPAAKYNYDDLRDATRARVRQRLLDREGAASEKEIDALLDLADAIRKPKPTAQEYIYGLTHGGFDNALSNRRARFPRDEHNVPPPNLDLAIVTVARNPFAPKNSRVAIIAAGVHGPGTSAAVHALCNPAFFAERPAGGILRVPMSGTDAAPEKVSRARYEWPESGPDWNGPYTYADLERRFEQLLARPPGQRVGAFDEADDARLSALATFARRLAEWHRPAAPDADAAP